jgi:F420-non-reducing hydrogenase large subunit
VEIALKELVLQPATRIEGHAKVIVRLDDKGEVEDARVHIIELRGFERFCVGRRAEDMPWITTRICGVCPWAHHLASVKAVEAAFGVRPPEAAVELRHLAYLCDKIVDYILHFYFMAGPDFLVGPTKKYEERNIFNVITVFPEIASRIVRARSQAHMLTELIAGKRIHPVAAVPGGFSKPLKVDDKDKAKELAVAIRDFAIFTMDFAKKNMFPQYIDQVKELGLVRTAFLGLVDSDGRLNHYDGRLRYMRADGSTVEFDPAEYSTYIGEQVKDWSYVKFPYWRQDGGLSLDPALPKGVYRVGPLARVNCCDAISTPLAQSELKEFRRLFGRPAQPPLLYNYARIIELLYAAERVCQMLADPGILSTEVKKAVSPREGRGVGVVEASRGTLIHDYTTDAEGLIKKVNLVVATTHNNAAINMSVKQAATSLIKHGKYNEGLLNQIEMVIRAHDPCLSCATHLLNGRIALQLDIMKSDGSVRTMCNSRGEI